MAYFLHVPWMQNGVSVESQACLSQFLHENGQNIQAPYDNFGTVNNYMVIDLLYDGGKEN
jgi:hypothetical protein